MLTLLVLAAAAAVGGCAREGRSSSARDSPPDSLDAPAAAGDSAAARDAAAASDSAASRDSAVVRSAPRTRAAARLGPLADSISSRIVWVARDQRWFLAAVRGGRLLLDLGRVDVPVKTPPRLTALRDAAGSFAPLRVDDHLRLAGSWGTVAATVTGYDVWNGRVVATLDVPPAVDSALGVGSAAAGASPGLAPGAAARGEPPQRVAAAVRADGDSAAAGAVPAANVPGAAPACARDSVSPELASRAQAVSDSVGAALRAETATATERYRSAVRLQATRVVGCFGGAPILVLVALRAGNDEYTRERAALVDSGGRVTAIRVSDYRFRAHEAIHALDADGDGVDDLAARGVGRRVGSLVVLRLDLATKRLDRLAGGFAWEGQ